MARPCRLNGRVCSGETGTTLFTLEGPNQGSPAIDWCDQVEKVRKKRIRLEGYAEAGRNSIIGLIMAN